MLGILVGLAVDGALVGFTNIPHAAFYPPTLKGQLARRTFKVASALVAPTGGAEEALQGAFKLFTGILKKWFGS